MKQLLLFFLLIASPFLYSQTNIDDEEEEEIQFTPYDKLPEFRGGVITMAKYFNTNTIYTQQALDDSVQGKVVIEFEVTKEGAIANPFVAISLHKDLDSICLHMVKNMPKWKPAMFQGKPVYCKYAIPIIFKLPRPETREYWLKEGKKTFRKTCYRKFRKSRYECNCWYKFVIANYNLLNLNDLDLNELFKFKDCGRK